MHAWAPIVMLQLAPRPLRSAPACPPLPILTMHPRSPPPTQDVGFTHMDNTVIEMHFYAHYPRAVRPRGRKARAQGGHARGHARGHA